MTGIPRTQERLRRRRRVTASQLRVGLRCFGCGSFGGRSFGGRSLSSRSCWCFGGWCFGGWCFGSRSCRCFSSWCFSSRCGSAASFRSRCSAFRMNCRSSAFRRSSRVSCGRSRCGSGRGGGSRLAADEQNQRQQSEILLHGNLPQSSPRRDGHSTITGQFRPLFAACERRMFSAVVFQTVRSVLRRSYSRRESPDYE